MDSEAVVEDVKVSEPNPSVSANIQQAEVIKAEEVNNTNKDINNQIENIISDIDINIKAQEKITQLKEQELALIQKQKELANQIHQQQILAQKLIAENQLKEQELKSQQIQQQQQLDFLKHQQYKDEFVPKASDEYASSYNQQHDDFNNFKESSNVSRTVDLRKIFTPATDAPQILPKNRKLYASSAFYSPTLHPTVEDQVELARRISHSLSDISNQTSKGQSMYVNRKKRSVKWVHEGSAQGEDDIIETNSLCKENAEANMKQELTKLDKMPLKLIMNPRGQMRDYNSLKESINIETGLLSPDNCAELITALQLQKGRGAELFAKRRRKAENWVVDETNAGTHSPSGIPDFQQYQAKPSTSPSILPAYSDAGKHRVQLNLHQDQLIEKYSKPGVQVIKSPWEAALQTGSASSAFVQDQKYGNQTPMLTPTPMASVASPVHFNQDVNDFPGSTQSHHSRPIPAMNYATQEPHKNNFDKRFHNQPIQPCNPQRELAYKPSVAQGWGGRNVELPREYYHQEFENYNADDMNCYYIDPNENNILEHQNTTLGTDLPYYSNNQFIKRQSLLNFNDEVQQRLQQLEYFQQKLALGLGLGLDLENKPIGMPCGHRALSTDSLNSSVNYHSHKPTSTNRNLNVNLNRVDCESETTKQTTSQNKEQESESENIESVNVRELIYSFEQQSLRDHEENKCKESKSIVSGEERLIANDSKIANNNPVLESAVNQIDTCTTSTTTIKGLYVPKEISLASYAPPPAQASHSYQGAPKVDYAKEYSSGAGEAFSGFPMSNTTSGFYSSPQAQTQTPKQQLYAPQSYQKVPTSSMQAAPQVNFNPSPLAFEKLSKFQEFDQKNAGVSSPRYLNVNKHQPGFNCVRNVTPTPFGSAEIEDCSTFENLQGSPVSTISKKFDGYQQPTSGQSFNNCARGWMNGGGSGAQRNGNVFPSRGQAVPSTNLPYSDF
ncbi:uncharacterized protein LOC117791050 isoform X2 [Drosophila innubila]|uniref:uncharacterized protein LOC117791050 isoform X2 n=1 Tax=Drosophila innubila TaxID=198719 RepID=UPI00148BB59B|nr:uncharacterized protein LOC117791050 isoform X2 [Drosophila innubila]